MDLERARRLVVKSQIRLVAEHTKTQIAQSELRALGMPYDKIDANAFHAQNSLLRRMLDDLDATLDLLK